MVDAAPAFTVAAGDILNKWVAGPYNAIPLITTWFPFEMNIKSKSKQSARSSKLTLAVIVETDNENDMLKPKKKLAININRKSESLGFHKIPLRHIQNFSQNVTLSVFFLFFFICFVLHNMNFVPQIQ